MEGKPLRKSKTFWVNLIALIALIVQTQTGFVVTPEEQTAIVVVINMILRAITKEPIRGV
ncbi:hypothetical protein DRP04_03560 [Archaeoglobales archaeon]|nr:MAG: hypothetical protein DRP04_03560 [Archaeoglobales archaeon]